MILILGGDCSGRHAFFESLHISPEFCHTVSEADVHAFSQEENGCAPLCPQLSATCVRLASFSVVIATEMGLGIIPLEKSLRKEREQNGRLNIALAYLADCVVLMTAGIPRVIKGSLNCLQKKSRALMVFRHGATQANLEKRYAGGATDLDLCAAGKEQVLRTKDYLASYAASLSPALREQVLSPKKVYVSPMKRALQTAKTLYPEAEVRVVDSFREMDFGLFENRTADELFADDETRALYQAFVDSNAQMKCPPSEKSAGESIAQFIERTARAFTQIVSEDEADSIVVVAHGGTQMALFSQFSARPLERQSDEVSSYYGWQTVCGMFRFGEINVTNAR
ncbi:MAG: bifunctional adenosylcobinamide kinase/adenosylcobinamide-phosphate guanylyltransferase [Treponema sp.]|nr:bifunctional adenosylcobinamide kinase/adenosylcobinamide-phosphate guanylyltransferase [Treponema sp.]